ncbi:hypothetical protein J4Q44_G00193910 [Coregonus suidteri]|uniref:Uncharacterized protein n=1 Tax=Coregonus suidteri TaxID=861788 RepID=A0AAN8LEV0_9TELE
MTVSLLQPRYLSMVLNAFETDRDWDRVEGHDCLGCCELTQRRIQWTLAGNIAYVLYAGSLRRWIFLDG